MKNLKYIFAVCSVIVSLVMFFGADAATTVVTTMSAAPIAFTLEKERKIFDAIRPLAQKGYNPMPYTLWIESQISNNKSSYTFDPRSAGSNTNANLPQQRLLDQEDLLVVTAIGIFIYEADTTSNSTLAKVKLGLQTFPNDGYFTADAGFTPDDLFQLYAGNLQCKIGTNVIMEALPVDNALVIPQKQLGDPATALYNQRELGDGYIVLPTNLLLDGNQDNKFTLEAPTFDGIAWEQSAANKAVKVVLRARGLNIKGGSKVREDIQALLRTISY